ncbi:MAG TPA: IS701 family transposase [Ktedonobacterales bacterium]
MDLEDLALWAEAFAAYCARFDDLFVRSESRAQARKYLRGLVAPLERKTSWQLAEAAHDTTPDRMQRLLYRVPWDADAARDRLEQFVIERFGETEGIGVLDETGIPKKGTRSVGVAKQYCGAVGKLENCQVATLLTYASGQGHVFLDRRLYLPESWCWDRARRLRAHVPATVRFQTKPQQARAMLEHAWELGVPMRWVTGDSVYGDSPDLRAAIEASGHWYVLALTGVIRCWLEPPPLEGPQAQTGGRPRRGVRLAKDAPKAKTVAEVIAAVPKRQWKRLSVGTGTKGPRIYDWARVRVIESRDGFPGPQVWLLARRAVSDPTELTYYFALAPQTVALQQLARVAGTRYTVEQVIKEAKSEVGFDRYEVRFWHSWYRHITLSMLAQVWLADQRRAAGEKNGSGGPHRPRSAAALGRSPPLA